MKVPFGAVCFGTIGLFALVLIAIGPPNRRTTVSRPTPSQEAPSTVSIAGFTMTSVSMDLPIDDQQYPDGLHAEVVKANCTSCHSPSMAMVQPDLSADQWRSIVVKMRDVYKAPIDEKNIPLIVEYLMTMSTHKDGNDRTSGKSYKKTVAKVYGSTG